MGEIVAETGLSKTTVFDYIKGIPRSKELKAKLLAITEEKQRVFAARRRGKSAKSYPHWEPTEWTSSFVNLVAHFIFDGEIKRTAVVYNNRSEALVNAVISEMEELMRVSDYKSYKDRNGVIKLCYYHVEIATFFKQKALELIAYIPDACEEDKIAFLKAFYDDEGNVTFIARRRERAVRGYQHSIEILDLVQKLLADFGIESCIQENFYEISITRRADIFRFRSLINFSEGVRVNGLRSNSVWKESLEKREILDRLVASYVTAGVQV